MDALLSTAFVATRSVLSTRADDDTTTTTTTAESFWEAHKTMIIAIGAMIPIQIIAGYFYMKRRKAKKIAFAALEDRIERLEMGQQKFGIMSENETGQQKYGIVTESGMHYEK